MKDLNNETDLPNPTSVQLVTHRLHRCQIDVPELGIPDNSTNVPYDTTLGVKILPGPFDKSLGVFVDTSITFSDISKLKSLEFGASFIFQVEDFDKLVTTTDLDSGEIRFELDSLLATVLAGLAYSTFRGIISVILGPTVFQNLYLPISDPKSLIEIPEGNPYSFTI